MNILKFSASWCGPCKQLSATMATMQLPCGVTEIDIDEDAKMSEKYAIRGVPTLVAVDDTGTELGRLVGAKPAGMVQAWITKVTA